MPLKEAAAPVPGQIAKTPTRPSQVLAANNRHASVINVSPDVPTALDVRIRDRYVRYCSDPRAGKTAGLWRTGGDGVRERVSPLTLRRISVGRSGRIEILAVHPSTGDYYPFEGGVDEIVSEIHRAGARLGCRAERRRIFWALTEFVAWARRQAAARGAAE